MKIRSLRQATEVQGSILIIMEWKFHQVARDSEGCEGCQGWLARVTVVVGLVFLGPWWGPMNVICHSVNIHGGGDSTCRWWGHLATIWCNWTFCAHRWWGPKDLVQNCLHTIHTNLCTPHTLSTFSLVAPLSPSHQRVWGCKGWCEGWYKRFEGVQRLLRKVQRLPLHP